MYEELVYSFSKKNFYVIFFYFFGNFVNKKDICSWYQCTAYRVCMSTLKKWKTDERFIPQIPPPDAPPQCCYITSAITR